ncbi:hypothetical protein [Thalassotalea ganghwensis]
MTTELFFIYDSHCPWSYAATALVSEIKASLPEITITLLHCGRYQGDEQIGSKTLTQVSDDSLVRFSEAYYQQKQVAPDSTIAANLLAWLGNKNPEQALAVLVEIQKQHFQQGNTLSEMDDFATIISQFKLSPPNKVFKQDKYAKEAEFALGMVEELQEIIGTPAIPALLLAVEDDLVLLNHNLYLKESKAIVDAVKMEIKRA